jgi:hypothetical protein
LVSQRDNKGKFIRQNDIGPKYLPFYDMHTALLILATVISLVSFGCAVVIIIDAFYYEVWAGLLAFFVPIYFAYYAIFEFDHERKWLFVVGSLGGIILAALFYELAMGVPVMRPGSFIGPG